jgi:hypothetical protein
MGPCLLALLSAGRTAQARQVPCVMNFGSADLVARVCADVILGKKISCLVRRSAPLGLARGRLTERHFCAVLQRTVQCCNAPCGVATCRAVLQAITEPWAGSDVSRIRTTAVKSACGKFYIVNGKAQRPRRPFATRAMLSCRCHVSDVRAGTGPTAAMPNMRWDWAHPCHICTGTGPTPAMPHLHRDWAHPCDATSAPGPGSTVQAPRNGLRRESRPTGKAGPGRTMAGYYEYSKPKKTTGHSLRVHERRRTAPRTRLVRGSPSNGPVPCPPRGEWSGPPDAHGLGGG